MINRIGYVLLCLIVLISLFTIGCTPGKKIDEHFSIQVGKLDDDICLVYTDSHDYQFDVVKAKVESFKKYDNYIFITQHPLVGDSVNKGLTNYYIVDSRLDYSDERLQPLSITQHEFDSKLKAASNLAR